MTKIKITEEIKSEILSMFNEGKSRKEISEILGININTICSYMSKNKLSRRPILGNCDYFETIDSYSKAYILGFIAADGALVRHTENTYTLTITIKYEDKEVLEFIKKELNATHNLLEIRKKIFL